MPGRSRADRWPSPDFVGACDALVEEDDELVLDGIDRATRARVVVSMRDLGADVSAGFWDEEIARLALVRHPAAARVLAARIEDDRYFVVTTLVPGEAVSVKRRLEAGPLAGAEATRIAMVALEVAVELHALGLSASGTRLRSIMISPGGGFLVTTFGLHVDNDVEVFNDLREIALRVLGIVGGRHERGALIVPPGAFSAEVEKLLRRAVGVEWPELKSAAELLEALVAATGAKKRGNTRVHVTTRPIAQASAMYGSDLLLAQEFLAGDPLDQVPPPLPEPTKRK